MKDSETTKQRRCTAQAALAVAALGGRFYDAIGVDYSDVRDRSPVVSSFADYTLDWPALKGAVCNTRAEAVKAGAYYIERPLVAGVRNRYGWRLVSFSPEGGQSYNGEIFANADDFWSAMRTVEDLADRSKRKSERIIEIHGRRWFQKGPGNTYHSVEIIDGDKRHVVPFAYGYDSGYEQTALAILKENGYPEASYPLSLYCRENGIKLVNTVLDVPRRKDLHNGGKS